MLLIEVYHFFPTLAVFVMGGGGEKYVLGNGPFGCVYRATFLHTVYMRRAVLPVIPIIDDKINVERVYGVQDEPWC